MAIDLNKLVADAKARDEAAKKKLEAAQKSSGTKKVSSENIAKSRRYRDYAYQLMDSRKTFEDVIKRYANKIARGDKLDALEQDELNNAVEQYNRLDSAISKAQLDAYNIYVGGEPTPTPSKGKVTGGKVKKQTSVEMPMGAGTVVSEEVTTPTEKPKVVKKPSTKVTSGTMPTMPSGAPAGKAVSGSFNPAAFRAGEEASMGAVTPIVPGPKVVPGSIDAVMALAAQKYGGIDEIFRTNTELADLLRRAVGDINDPLDDYDISRFTSELENTKWFKENAGPIRQRGFYKRQYDSLVSGIKTDDPNYQSRIEELNRTSEYGRGLQNTIETVTEQWTKEYGTPTAQDMVTIKAIATELYDYANEGDDVKIRNLVLAKPKRFSPTAVMGGNAGENLTELKKIASANGLDLEKDFGTSIQTWLDRLAKGENIETIKSIIRNTAKTTWNVSDRISNLLDQGVDLSTIYAPYRTRMSNILEIAPETISFNDLASKGVIGGKEEKNLYDFEKELRKDSRWQYTRNANEEASSAALMILRNFGFQG